MPRPGFAPSRNIILKGEMGFDLSEKYFLGQVGINTRPQILRDFARFDLGHADFEFCEIYILDLYIDLYIYFANHL